MDVNVATYLTQYPQALTFGEEGTSSWRGWRWKRRPSTLALLVVAFPILFGGSLVALRRRDQHA